MGNDPWLLEAVGNGAGVRTDHMKQLIKKLGTPDGVAPDVMFGSQPIIRTVRSQMGYHFIVLDGNGKIFDPANSPLTTDGDKLTRETD